MLKDSEFNADFAKTRTEFAPMSGEALRASSNRPARFLLRAGPVLPQPGAKEVPEYAQSDQALRIAILSQWLWSCRMIASASSRSVE
jgi:hypothetical protein